MISLLLVVKLTVILAVGSAGFALSSRISAAARHLLCAFTLAIALLLPLTLQLPPTGSSRVYSFIADVSATVANGNGATFRWLPILWAAGASVVLLRFVIGGLYFAWRTRGSAAIDEASLTMGACVRLAQVTTPVVWGWVRPTVLVPFSFAEWTSERKHLAITHELAHIRRGDNWVVLIAVLARALYWFHPLVWWLAAKLQEQQEFACDERVLATGVSSSEYASLLVDVVRQLPSPALFGCAMVSRRGNFRGRIMHILNFHESSCSSWLNRLAVVSGLSVLLLASALVPARADQATNKQRTIYKIGGDVIAPKLIYKVEPEYSKESRDSKVHGAVVLEVMVDTDGTAKDIQVKRSLTPDLDKNAVAAVEKWRFQPATKNGEPVPVHANIEVNFRLK